MTATQYIINIYSVQFRFDLFCLPKSYRNFRNKVALVRLVRPKPTDRTKIQQRNWNRWRTLTSASIAWIASSENLMNE